MEEVLGFALLGLGLAACYMMLSTGIVIAYRSSGVINFAQAAIGMYLAHAFYTFRETGDLVLPIVGLPERVHLLPRPTVITALAVMIVYAALLGALIYTVVIRHLVDRSPLARVVATIGLFLYFWAMVSLRFANPPAVRKILPATAVEWFGQQIFRDRLYFFAISVLVVAVLWWLYRYTTFGLRTTAINETLRGARISGIRIHPVASINWMIATVTGGVAMVLVTPITQLDPLNMSLMVVGTLGAALLGGMRDFVPIAVAATVLGMLQSEAVLVQSKVDALSGLGLQQGLPFLLIIVALMVRPATLPSRGDLGKVSLPESPTPRRWYFWSVGGLAAGVVITMAGDADWRTAVINSGIAVIISLSIVVLTGYVGQISLAPFAFAGVAAFAVPLLDDFGFGFPLAPILAVAIATLVGVLVGIPGVRTRGLNLAVATLGASVAIEKLLFKSDWFVHPSAKGYPPARIGGLDLSVATLGSEFPRRSFGIAVVVVAVLAGSLIALLRIGPLGRAWLAVRSNERAALASGVDARRVKLAAFACSAALAGTAGVLMGYQRGNISTDSFQAFLSLAALALTYLAGISSISGAVLAGMLTPLGVFTLLSGGDMTHASKYSFVLNGALLILVAVVAPSGLIGTLRKGVDRLTQRVVSRPLQAEA